MTNEDFVALFMKKALFILLTMSLPIMVKAQEGIFTFSVETNDATHTPYFFVIDGDTKRVLLEDSNHKKVFEETFYTANTIRSSDGDMSSNIYFSERKEKDNSMYIKDDCLFIIRSTRTSQSFELFCDDDNYVRCLLSSLFRDQRYTTIDNNRGVPLSPFFKSGVCYYYSEDLKAYTVGEGDQLSGIVNAIFSNRGFLETYKKQVLPTTLILEKKIFSSWRNGTDIDIDVKEISPLAFDGCDKFKEVIIMGIPIVGMYAFRNCKSLVKIDFRMEGTELIDSYAFADCSNVKEISFNFYSNPPEWNDYQTAFKDSKGHGNTFKIIVNYGDPVEVNRFKKAYPSWSSKIIGINGLGFGSLPLQLNRWIAYN